MSMPFYMSPEQVMKDRSDYARKGVAQGRSAVAVAYAGGILMAAENTSRTLRKISEIYDRIGFAAAGKYNEFDTLRKGGVRLADSLGYQYSREDVTGRALAEAYAQSLGQIFTHEMKPMEVDILVVEVGHDPSGDELYHVLYNGIVLDVDDVAVVGGDADAITARLKEAFTPDMDLQGALQAAATALAGPDRTLSAREVEAAVLERDREGRTFRRLLDDEIASLLGQPAPDENERHTGEETSADAGAEAAADGDAEA